MAESVLRLVSPGTHHSHKYIKPAELDGFFDSIGWKGLPAGLAVGPATATTPLGAGVGGSVREARGVAYLPWKGEWELMSPGLGELGKQCNYYYFVRRPAEGELPAPRGTI
jgi:polyprenyldihydroxybenzoate methyltransferase/3-demethylubiquinol 3-O-methyltransferase